MESPERRDRLTDGARLEKRGSSNRRLAAFVGESVTLLSDNLSAVDDGETQASNAAFFHLRADDFIQLSGANGDSSTETQERRANYECESQNRLALSVRIRTWRAYQKQLLRDRAVGQ